MNQRPLFCGVFGGIAALFVFIISQPASGAVGDAPNGSTSIATGALASQTSGSFNVALGLQALNKDTSGGYNTAAGVNALYNNTTGFYNTALGLDALYSNTTSGYNTATGAYALYNNTGAFNTATGTFALSGNTTGSLNSAVGYQALTSNGSGKQNTAMGYAALNSSTADSNTAFGYAAAASTTTGSNNVAVGSLALRFNTQGLFNVAVGEEALRNLTTGLNNIAIGYNAGQNFTGSEGQNIIIGQGGVAGDNRVTRIGASQLKVFIYGINGQTEGGANPKLVYIDDNNQLGTAAPGSSRRFKKDIQPMDKTSDGLLKLKPVTFHYKNDSKNTAQFGLIAEEVAEVNPDLVSRDKDGEIYTVRYDAVNVLLLNEFLKEHRKVEEQQATIARMKSADEKQQADISELKSTVQVLTAGLKAQGSELQAVRNQMQTQPTAAHLAEK